ncbi:MAG: nuclear transport factor 2 family protein [Mycobacterium sp.]|uniref:nuclear transport factor 2 family protein n=1 Tax=Mycobacterium sp. TaxID=1785 RepID=UPI00389A7FCB
MPVETKPRFLVGSGKRRVLRVAVALGTATILGTVGVGVGGGVANADLLCGVPTSQADSGPEVDAIKQLKTSYFQNIDAKNWDALRELLDPLIVVDTTCSAGPILTGRDPFIAFLQLTLGGANTHHQGSDPQIHLTSATTAEGVWTLEDVLIFGGTLGVHGYGHYQDRYVKTGGKWMEKYSKLTRTRIDLINPDGTVIQADAPLDQVAAKVKAVTGQ